MLLKVNDAAKELGYSASTVYQLVYSGELPAVQRKKGAAVRIAKEDIEKYISDNYSGTANAPKVG